MVDLMEELFQCDSENKGENSSLKQSYVTQHLLQIQTDGEFSILYLFVEACSDMYLLYASNGQLTWKGSLYCDDIRKFAKTAKIDEKSLLDETEKALSESNNLEFVFNTKLGHDMSLKLTWKKNLDSKDITLQLGCVQLQPQSNSSVGLKMLNFAVSELAHLSSKIKQMELEMDRIRKERQLAISRLNSAVNAKEELEVDLFEKFILLLNEKKHKIRDISDRLSSFYGTEEESDLPQVLDSKQHASSVDSGLLLSDQNEISNSSPPIKRRKRESKQTNSSKLIF